MCSKVGNDLSSTTRSKTSRVAAALLDPSWRPVRVVKVPWLRNPAPPWMVETCMNNGRNHLSSPINRCKIHPLYLWFFNRTWDDCFGLQWSQCAVTAMMLRRKGNHPQMVLIRADIIQGDSLFVSCKWFCNDIDDLLYIRFNLNLCQNHWNLDLCWPCLCVCVQCLSILFVGKHPNPIHRHNSPPARGRSNSKPQFFVYGIFLHSDYWVYLKTGFPQSLMVRQQFPYKGPFGVYSVCNHTHWCMKYIKRYCHII